MRIDRVDCDACGRVVDSDSKAFCTFCDPRGWYKKAFAFGPQLPIPAKPLLYQQRNVAEDVAGMLPKC